MRGRRHFEDERLAAVAYDNPVSCLYLDFVHENMRPAFGMRFTKQLAGGLPHLERTGSPHATRASHLPGK